MSDTKPRGRPATGTALSTAERTRRLHGKARGALDTVDISHFPESALLLAMATAYRTRQPDAFARIAGELSRRLGLSVETTVNQPVSILVDTTTIETPLTVETTLKPKPNPRSLVDNPEIVRRVLALAHLSEKKASAQLRSDGIKIGPRTVGAIRKTAAKTTKPR
jgi:hypothetical protein